MPGGVWYVHLAPETLNSLLTTTEAANVAGVAVYVISKWRERGHLKPADEDERGRPLYRFIDVAKAERATRDLARRTYPQGAA